MACNKRILLVEDNYMNRVLVREILNLKGFEVIEATNGAEAIRILAEQTPDLILMDLHLPEMDGITATRIIKAQERYRNIPVLALTAAGSREDEDEMMARGFDGFVTKPIDSKGLLATIERFCEAANKRD